MKTIDSIENDPDVRKERKRYADLLTRETEITDKLRELRQISENGLDPDSRAARAELILAGQPLPDTANIDAELGTAMLNWRALLDAKEIQPQRIENARREAGRKLCEKLRPEHDRLQKQLATALTDAHAAWAELFGMKRGVLNQGAGLNGLFRADAQDFLGSPSDRSSEFADFMRDAARAGHCRELPR